MCELELDYGIKMDLVIVSRPKRSLYESWTHAAIHRYIQKEL